ncbi:unnamed protein product [Heligmosomoides polygyrus]|uniref:Uncharacterized protein n=1 Tax=Heligmosomoides polygyrus TaxID=6339 RepID=A0A183F2I7_HELPZ|nr:unnamed protein product [Heligmosomoides polygyrus]
MRFRINRNTLTTGVTRPVPETTITTVTVLRSTYVPIKVTSDYVYIFRRYFCCLLIKQAPKLILGLIGATSLRSIRYRSETIIPTPLVVLGLPHRTALKPRPMSLDKRQDHLVSCTAQKSTLLRSSASTNSYDRPVNVPTFSVAPAYVTGLPD